MKNLMKTEEIIRAYFDGIRQKNGWQSLISDKMTFTSPGGSTKGKDAYVETTDRFLRVVKTAAIKDMIIQEDKACVLVDYELQSPKSNTTNCVVAEILSVKDNKISSSAIFFDTAAFRNFMAQG